MFSRRDVLACPPKEPAAHRTCVNENAPGAGVEAQQSTLTDNLMEPPPEAAYLLSGESNAQANLDHTPWSHEQC